MINYELSVHNGQVAVKLVGSIYVEEAASLREILIKQIEAGQVNFSIDFTRVDYIDSSGLGVLVSIQKRALVQGGQVRISGLTGLVKELFELTRLNKVFEVS